MKPEEKIKLESKLDRLAKKLTDIYKMEKAIRIEIHVIHAKLNEDARR